MTAGITAGSRFATRIFLPQIRLIPTQKISTFPTKERYPMAVSVMIGRITVASRVTAPSQRNTGIAEKTQPFPRELVMTITMTRSRMDLVPSVYQSPEIPSCMAPTIAMAPMHTVRDAVRKPFTN